MATPPRPLLHFRRALSHWPRDPLRPEVNFQKILSNRIESLYNTNPNNTSTAASTSPSVKDAGGRSIEPSKHVSNSSAASPPSEESAMRQVNALYSLLENRYQNEV